MCPSPLASPGHFLTLATRSSPWGRGLGLEPRRTLTGRCLLRWARPRKGRRRRLPPGAPRGRP
eukprot:5165910-Alexandrium_andersonii.AAC.1